ncbi:uncharacterized protein LOC129289920 [Prosopis cineraria]|uniref:uncharacterized protein LOC129289920 n=1 Tax=Prosopis cineraria TaxID=364024 RepID=UPI00240F1799|nr:uncharacterized protein LOC129289920 [Prosopis cineraria]
MEEHVSNANEPNALAPSKSIPENSASKKKPPTMLVENYFAFRTTPGSQSGIKSAFATKEAQHSAKMAIAKWAIINCIPFNALDCPFFQKAVDAIASIGSGFKGPTAYKFRVNLLNNWKKELFVKSVDASNLVKDAKTLFLLFSEVIECVGPKNIVHVVTDNVAIYVACGKLVKEKYKSIYWSPYATHCSNLTLKDIASMSHVSQLATKASKITVFVYNHMVFLSWLRKRKGWKEIVRPGVTRFATTFITLHSIYMHKHDLQALITDKHFVNHKLSRIEVGIIVSAIILDNQFWNECLEVVKIVSPLIKLLRIVDLDEKPPLPYVYEGMQRAKKAIKAIFNNKKDQYKPYTDIIQA